MRQDVAGITVLRRHSRSTTWRAYKNQRSSAINAFTRFFVGNFGAVRSLLVGKRVGMDSMINFVVGHSGLPPVSTLALVLPYASCEAASGYSRSRL